MCTASCILKGMLRVKTTKATPTAARAMRKSLKTTRKRKTNSETACFIDLIKCPCSAPAMKIVVVKTFLKAEEKSLTSIYLLICLPVSVHIVFFKETNHYNFSTFYLIILRDPRCPPLFWDTPPFEPNFFSWGGGSNLPNPQFFSGDTTPIQPAPRTSSRKKMNGPYHS